MKVPSGILLAIQIAENNRESSAQRVASIEREHANASGQLQLLMRYSKETDSRWSTSSQRITFPTELMLYQQFNGRLVQAMELQLACIEECALRLEVARAALLAADLRVSRMNTLLKARQRNANMSLARAEQRQTDEFATLVTGRSRGMVFRSETP